MQHSLHIENFGVRLRPVRMEDSAFIVWLRNLDFVRGRVGDSAADVASQEKWLRNYFQTEGDYYFITETLAGIPVGTHGLYGITGSSAEQGRNIVRPDVMAGVPAALLATDLAFGQMGLTELRGNAVSTNVTIHSLHRKWGFEQIGVLRAAQIIGGQPVDLIQYRLKKEKWLQVRDRLVPLATVAGSQVLEWEKSQSGATHPWNGTRPGPNDESLASPTNSKH